MIAMKDNMKERFMKRYKSYEKSQVMFLFLGIFVAIMAVIIGLTTMFNNAMIVICMLTIVFMAGLLFEDAKKRKEDVQDLMALYTIKKTAVKEAVASVTEKQEVSDVETNDGVIADEIGKNIQ